MLASELMDSLQLWLPTHDQADKASQHASRGHWLDLLNFKK